MQKTPSKRNHLLLLAAIAFFAGCRLGTVVEGGVWQWALLGLGIAAGAAFLLSKRSAMAAFLLCACALGMLRIAPALEPPAPWSGKYETITGYVYGEERLRSDHRITFTLGDVELNGRRQSGKAYCTCYYGDEEPPVFFDGAKLTFSGRVYHPDGKSGQPRFDFRSWMLQHGMSYGIAISQTPTVENTPQSAPVKDLAYRIKSLFRSALTRTMGDEADIAMALLFSDRGGVEEQEYDAFARLGIAHVMSVSGLHVGIVGAVLYWVLNKLRLGRIKWIVLAVLLAGYCLLTGFSAASVRAAVMLLISRGAAMLKKRSDPLTNLGAAMLVVMVISPLQTLSAGFVLSVSAVLGILVIKPALMRLVRSLRNRQETEPAPDGWLMRNLVSPFLFSLSAQIGVWIPTALYFHQLPVYGVFINVLMIPYVSLLVPVYMLALLLAPVPWLGMAVGHIAALLSKGLLLGVNGMSQLPFATVRIGTQTAWIAAAVIAFVVLLVWAVRSGDWKRIVAVHVAALAAASVIVMAAPPSTRFVQLAVGQADAALLFDKDKTIAIDVGADGSATLDYLMDAGRDIDVLYLTHLHIDHAGGVPYLLESGVNIRQVYLPVNAALQRLDEEALAVLEPLKAAGIPISEIAAGEVHSYPTVTIRTHWPDADTVRTGQDANDLPMVLSLEMGGYTLLSASDLTGYYENYAAVPCDVLKVAHHGSSDSSGDAFLDRVSPGLALISCTSGSQSLPGAEMLQRLESRGIPYLRTDASGDITLYIDQGRLVAAPYKKK